MSWPIVKIEDIFDVARGGSPRPIDAFITDDPDGVNWIMIGDTKSGEKYISTTAKRIRPEGVKKSRVVKEGDFLLTNSMSFGRPYILKTSGCIHDGWLVLSPKSDNTHTDYFYYYLGSQEIKNKLAGKAAGAVVKNLNKDIVKGLEIPLPPLAEQKRIAAILDKADAIRQKRKQAIDLADEFLRSVFLDMFGDPVTNPKGWEVCELNSCLDFLTSGSRGWAKYYAEEGSKFIRIQNVGKNKLILNELAYVNAPDTKEAERTRVKVNDVLLSITADLGRSAVVTEELRGGHINQHLALLRLKTSKLEPQFLSALLSSEGALRQFKAKNKAAVKAGLNFDDIRTFEIYLPPLRTQSKYLTIYTTAMKNLNKLMIQRDNAEVLFSSLSQKAFSGQL